ncbi:Lar family restriction alleviation protein [Loktanella sp. DJP18]|uniref:Lar family restriction alleviation protein n=1 Tax=Loktanella sp. DJP18 TaxID=3409788 RepID=UPI003BB71D6A
MTTLIPCPFCGDEDATLKSGPCIFTRPKPATFMAQVHCAHCGAAGTRFCGEDNLANANKKAIAAWNAADRTVATILARVTSIARDVFSVSLAGWIICLIISDADLGATFRSLIIGSFIAGVPLMTYEHYRNRKA